MNLSTFSMLDHCRDESILFGFKIYNYNIFKTVLVSSKLPMGKFLRKSTPKPIIDDLIVKMRF